MKRLAWIAAAFLLPVMLPVRAQEESVSERAKEATGVTEHGGSELFWGSVNFLLLVGALGYLINKNAGPYFSHRSLEIRKGIADAEAARAESDAKVAEVDRRLADLQAEIEGLRRGAREEAKADEEQVRREAAAEMAKIQAHLTEEIAAAAKSARLELRRYAAGEALRLAGQRIAAGMSPETEDHLVHNFVTGISGQ